MCTLLAIAAVAQAQQTPGPAQTPPQTAQQGQDAGLQQNAQLQGQAAQQQGLDATRQTQQVLNNEQQDQFNQQQDQLDASQPSNQQAQRGQDTAQQDRSMIGSGTAQQGQPGTAGQRGELGVFVIESAGPGVRISRVTSGSAADQAGLEAGDVLMVINGQEVDRPQEVIRMIRALAAGELANLRVWRDGQEQEIAATLQPLGARDRYRSNFRGESSGMNGDLAQRTQRLEQQLGMVMQELQRLRQEVMRLRGGGGALGTTGIDPQQPPDTAQPGAEPFGQEATQPGLDKPTGQPTATDPETGLPF